MSTGILVVEPDGYTANHLIKFFGDEQKLVRHELSGRAGLEALRTVRPEITFVDLQLPDMDGRRFLADVTTSGLVTSVLMVSSKKNFSAVVECMKMGAFDFIEKPFHPDDFLMTFRKAEDRSRLEQEVRRLRTEVERGSPYNLLFGRSRRMRDLQAIVDQIADTDITVLLRGESGTGKDLLARTIYECSSRRDKPFVKVNCAALPRDLLESELFGYEQGAFTGAHYSKQGKFEYANGGTVFLDEISEMHVDLQAKLLHVLQDGEVCRLGGKEPVATDVRIIAATNRNIEEEVQQKRFRSDLFYRLNVVNMMIPPLRDRPEEIPGLVQYFAERITQQYRREGACIPEDLSAEMAEYHWPGNVRELENYMKRIVVVGDVEGVRNEIRNSRRILMAKASKQQAVIDPKEFEGKTLREISREAIAHAERRIISKVLHETRWNRKRAAELLDISYKALLYKIRQTGLE